jgi:hypothetical protein
VAPRVCPKLLAGFYNVLKQPESMFFEWNLKDRWRCVLWSEFIRSRVRSFEGRFIEQNFGRNLWSHFLLFSIPEPLNYFLQIPGGHSEPLWHLRVIEDFSDYLSHMKILWYLGVFREKYTQLSLHHLNYGKLRIMKKKNSPKNSV